MFIECMEFTYCLLLLLPKFSFVLFLKRGKKKNKKDSVLEFPDFPLIPILP